MVETFILPASTLQDAYKLATSFNQISQPTLIAAATHSELQESLPTCTLLSLGVLIAHTAIIPRVLHYPLWFPYPLFIFL